jgi:hypothetical protein
LLFTRKNLLEVDSMFRHSTLAAGLVVLLLCVWDNAQAFAVVSPYADVNITKLAPENPAEIFHFSGDFDDFSLSHNGTAYFTVYEDSFGEYVITEDFLTGWNLADISIVTDDMDDTSVIDLVNRTVTLDVDEWETMTVTFTNVTPEPATMVLLSAGGFALLRRSRR